ncbi:MAG: CHAT domain-containing protein, partial [candidate division Zixibacteria bacterium]|nr:CHAT domain-containing protein [candidate division Zixibacteria bacterium]
GDAQSRTAELQDEAQLFRSLGDWLWAPLEISSAATRVLVLPDGKLSNLPWSAISVDGRALCERHNVLLAPSLRHYLRARALKAQSRRVELFVGRSDNLAGVADEVNVFTDVSDRSLHIHNPCRRDDWPHDGRADVWHYTGHAQLRNDNPFYSSLLLADGPLFAADFRLKSSKVNLVTLAACRTGEQVYMPGEEAAGLVRALLEMGARSVLAGLWSVADRSTSQWMQSFYTDYFAGMPPEQCYRRATLEVRETYPSAYNWAAFAMFGAG